MHKHVVRSITILAAVLVSGLAAVMAWASAMQRATAQHDQLLLACVGAVVVLAVHLLPALLRGRHPLVLWPVWVMCFALAGFGHASWFYLSGQSAAEVRRAGSAAARAVAAERAAIEQTLSTIRSRPMATVAAQLSRTIDSDRREALALELAEARRAAGLRDRLIVLSGTASGTLQVHPGTPGYGSGTAGTAVGTESGTAVQIDMTMIMSVVTAVVIELLGALLWSAALRVDDDAEEVAKPMPAPAPTVLQRMVNLVAPITSRSKKAVGVEVVNDTADEVAVLRAAIERGECRSSVRSIKEYMACGSDAASRLRRQLFNS